MTVAEKYGVDNLSRIHDGKYDYSRYEYTGAEVHAKIVLHKRGCSQGPVALPEKDHTFP